MELLLQDSILMASLVVSAAALYARAASSSLRPGLPRLVALLPVIAFLATVPLAFVSSAIVRVVTAFFFAWLAAFKVALLAMGLGPLDPNFPILPFIFTAVLPVKLAAETTTVPNKARSTPSLFSCAVKIAAFSSLVHVYQFMDQLHLYVRRTLYGAHMYCFLDLLLTCVAVAGGALGLEIEPPFDRPYMASSLRDFWGRRWNLVVSAVLRAAVYHPVRARAGKPVGVLATFLVSGLMHEAMLFYLRLQWPTGEMLAFFLIHGTCRVAEEWCAKRWTAKDWAPRVATPLVIVFVTGTAFWLVFPPVCRDGGDEVLLAEWVAVVAFFIGAQEAAPVVRVLNVDP